MTEPVYLIPRDVIVLLRETPEEWTNALRETIRYIFEEAFATASGLVTGEVLELNALDDQGSVLMPRLRPQTEYVTFKIQEQMYNVITTGLRDWYQQSIHTHTFEELGKAGIGLMFIETRPDGVTVQNAWEGLNLLFDNTGLDDAGDLADTPIDRLYNITLRQYNGEPFSHGPHLLEGAQIALEQHLNPPPPVSTGPDPDPEPGTVHNDL